MINVGCTNKPYNGELLTCLSKYFDIANDIKFTLFLCVSKSWSSCIITIWWCWGRWRWKGLHKTRVQSNSLVCSFCAWYVMLKLLGQNLEMAIANLERLAMVMPATNHHQPNLDQAKEANLQLNLQHNWRLVRFIGEKVHCFSSFLLIQTIS